MRDINFFDKKFFFIFLFFLVIGFSFDKVNSNVIEIFECYNKKTGVIERTSSCDGSYEVSVEEGLCRRSM